MFAPYMLALAIAAAPAEASSPPVSAVGDQLIRTAVERAVFEAATGPLASPVAQPGGDSLHNGATIGAIVAGAAMFASTAWLCLATREEGDPHCFGPVFFWTAVGAGAGALMGAGVDALIQRRIAVRWTVRF